MKETGLMFKAPLVRSILDGTKTQTRRVAKLPHANPLGEWEAVQLGGPDGGRTSAGKTIPAQMGIGHTRTGEILTSPNGGPGDRIYVRETWQGPIMGPDEWEAYQNATSDMLPGRFRTPAYCQYAADGGAAPEFMTADDDLVCRWRPSIHMPKWAARIWLDITGVRVERLQQISDADCWAEGAIAAARPDQFSEHGVLGVDGKAYLSPRAAFQGLWTSTGGDWAANPWVWVIDFKRGTALKGQP